MEFFRSKWEWKRKGLGRDWARTNEILYRRRERTSNELGKNLENRDGFKI